MQDIMAALKEQTRAEHEALENVVDVLRPEATLADYRAYLERMLGFIAPLEERLLRAASADDETLNLPARQKAAWLRQDLAALGRFPHVPPCPLLPELPSAAHRVGCLYVLEGSTLGGQLILRELRARHGTAILGATRFLEGYGQHTGPMWQAFRDAARAHPAVQADPDLTIAGALSTFQHLHRWYLAPRAP